MTSADEVTQTISADDVRDAARRLRAARELLDALRPLERVITDAQEEMRAATLAAADAGLSQRAIASELDVTQPIVGRTLDARRGEPLPGPTPTDRAWTLHRVLSTVWTLTKQMQGEELTVGLNPRIQDPRETLYDALQHLDQAAKGIADLAAELQRGEAHSAMVRRVHR